MLCFTLLISNHCCRFSFSLPVVRSPVSLPQPPPRSQLPQPVQGVVPIHPLPRQGVVSQRILRLAISAIFLFYCFNAEPVLFVFFYVLYCRHEHLWLKKTMPLENFMGLVESFSLYQGLLRKDPQEAARLSADICQR